MKDLGESADGVDEADAVGAVEEVDALLASVGLRHGRRETLGGTWQDGERKGRALQRRMITNEVHSHGLGVVRAAGWERYGWIRHGFSTRAGGVSRVYSQGPIGELNLGWTKEDDPENVLENRRRFIAGLVSNSPAAAKHRTSEAMDTSRSNLVGLRQFHSGMIRIVDASHGVPEGKLQTEDGRPVLRGDGLMTDVPGIMLGVGVADCVPVLVADVRQRAVAALHAGWRGTLARIVERAIGTMRMRYGSRPQDVVAVIGPAIGACCYSVGEDVRSEFGSQFGYAPELFSEVYDSDPVREKYPLLFMTARAPGHSDIGPQIHLDLAEANRRQLLAAGLPAANVTMVGECTACTRLGGGRLKYFSHRGENGFAGRMMAAIGVLDRV